LKLQECLPVCLNVSWFAPGSQGKDWKSVLKYLVPTWNQKGTNLEALDWPKKQPLSREEIEKVPRWEEKSTNLVHKKIRIIISILCLVSDSISLDDLMTSMDYQNRKTFRDNYLKPLEMVQFIVKTNPDKPNNPEQKYKITEKGKSFLGGIGN